METSSQLRLHKAKAVQFRCFPRTSPPALRHPVPERICAGRNVLRCRTHAGAKSASVPVTPAAQVSKSNDIGEEAAKKIALKHAGIAEADGVVPDWEIDD